MKDDATQENENTGVSEVEETATDTTEKKPVLSPHAEALQEIVMANRAKAEPKVEPVEPNEEPEVQEKTDEPEKVEQEEESDTIKVDGEERKVPKSKIYEAGIRSLQKQEAADKRLEEATRMQREAIELLNKTKQQPSLPDVVVEKDASDFEDVVTKASEAIQYGDEKAVRSALIDIIEAARKTNSPMPAGQDLQTMIQKGVRLSELHREIDKPYNPEDEDGSGCSDLLKSPYTYDMLRAKVDQKIKAGEGNGWDAKIYRDAAKEVRAELRGLLGVKTEPKVTTTVSDKELRTDRKRKITNVNTASGKLEATTEKKPLTAQEQIEKMARARGQSL